MITASKMQRRPVLVSGCEAACVRAACVNEGIDFPRCMTASTIETATTLDIDNTFTHMLRTQAQASDEVGLGLGLESQADTAV